MSRRVQLNYALDTTPFPFALGVQEDTTSSSMNMTKHEAVTQRDGGGALASATESM